MYETTRSGTLRKINNHVANFSIMRACCVWFACHWFFFTGEQLFLAKGENPTETRVSRHGSPCKTANWYVATVTRLYKLYRHYVGIHNALRPFAPYCPSAYQLNGSTLFIARGKIYLWTSDGKPRETDEVSDRWKNSSLLNFAILCNLNSHSMWIWYKF